MAEKIAPNNDGIICKNIIPLVSNKYHKDITLDRKLKQTIDIIPPNAPISKGGHSEENQSAVDAIAIAPANVAFHIC